MKFRLFVFSLLAVVFAAPCAWGKAAVQEPLIKVGLLTGQSSVTIAADASFFMSGAVKRGRDQSCPAGENLIVAVQRGRLTINGTAASAPVLRLGFSARDLDGRLEQAVKESGNRNRQGQFFRVNGKRYRGIIEIRLQGQGLTVVNILPLEAYLYGVVPKEIPPSWPLETIRAQAVAARSYALASGSKHEAQGFDVCPTVDCQVYGGRDDESERSNQAVDETRGMTVTYQGNVITAFFHASSGGHTENSENVWGTQLPYLRGVPDFDQQSPRFRWERRITITKLAELLRPTGVGEITAIELSPLGRQPVNAIDRGVSGRVKSILIVGKSGSVRLSGTKVSSLLGLPSTLFDVAIVRGNSVAAGKANGRWLVRDAACDTLLVNGRGAGHGIGLSQWGAKAMAEKAPPGSKHYFKKILTYYYPGAIVEKWYQ